jgi:hypothetical protein
MSLVTGLRHLFIPHHTNNHRAKVLHIDALLTYILFFALFNLGVKTIHRTVPDVLGYATDIHVEQLLSDTNAQRISAGLEPLTLNSELSAAAAAKASDMFAKNYWAHNSPSGLTPWDFIIQSGYHYTVAGENLAKNFSDSKAVVDAWMASPSHRANMIKPGYKEIGFAVVNGTLSGEETTLVVQMFGASSVSPVAEAPRVVIPEAAAAKVSAAEPTAAPNLGGLTPPREPQVAAVSGYQSVTKQPVFNIPTVSRDIVFAFMGIMMGVLLVDALVARRRHVFRIAGHNVAHIMFLIAVYILMSSIGRGRLL